MNESKLIEPMFEKEFEENMDASELFESHGLYMGRLVGQSKIGYMRSHPENEVVFNGNIIVESQGKIWFGDIDVTLESGKLQKIADTIMEDLYILRELDARFENEGKAFKFYKDKAINVIKCK